MQTGLLLKGLLLRARWRGERGEKKELWANVYNIRHRFTCFLPQTLRFDSFHTHNGVVYIGTTCDSTYPSWSMYCTSNRGDMDVNRKLPFLILFHYFQKNQRVISFIIIIIIFCSFLVVVDCTKIWSSKGSVKKVDLKYVRE